MDMIFNFCNVIRINQFLFAFRMLLEKQLCMIDFCLMVFEVQCHLVNVVVRKLKYMCFKLHGVYRFPSQTQKIYRNKVTLFLGSLLSQHYCAVLIKNWYYPVKMSVCLYSYIEYKISVPFSSYSYAPKCWRAQRTNLLCEEHYEKYVVDHDDYHRLNKFEKKYLEYEYQKKEGNLSAELINFESQLYYGKISKARAAADELFLRGVFKERYGYIVIENNGHWWREEYLKGQIKDEFKITPLGPVEIDPMQVMTCKIKEFLKNKRELDIILLGN